MCNKLKEVTVKIPEEVKTVIEIATGLEPEDVLLKVYDEILRNDADYGKISIKEAAETMNKSQQFVRVALQQKMLPFGAAVKMPSGKYSYYISPKKFYEFIGKPKKHKEEGCGNNAD